MLLEQINSPEDLKKLDLKEMPQLAEEIRCALIRKTSCCGGHLASNLGIVELTIALHYVFDSPKDKIIFDVSHQTYVHKMLTGRKTAFLDQGHYDDISGYSNPNESEHDLFSIGHTSTSISLACGVAKTRDLAGRNENVIAIIGDAALDGGEAFEGLNYAGELGTGLIVIVNDNDMSIPENYGTLSKQLTQLRENHGRIGCNFFESLGFDYHFVEDGHDITSLTKEFMEVKDTDHPVLVHCCTQKGRGYSFAENDREKWHWAHPFDVETGRFVNTVPEENYGAIVGDYLLEKMKSDPDVAVVAASTPLCIGFNAERRKQAGKQYIDVGIAEQHAVSMATGMAKLGGKPIFATNCTFYQRAYDQIEQELCITRCPVTMLVTHASVYGHTNDTHVGLYDIALFSNIHNLIYLAPTNKEEYIAMLDWSIEQRRNPVAIRVPWNGVYHTDREVMKDYSRIQYETVRRGSGVAVIALGSFFQLGEEVTQLLLKDTGINATLINPRFITGLDNDLLDSLQSSHQLVVTLEDGILAGGFGSRIAQYYGTSSIRVLTRGFSSAIPNRYIPSEWMKENRITAEQILEDIQCLLDEMRKAEE